MISQRRYRCSRRSSGKILRTIRYISVSFMDRQPPRTRVCEHTPEQLSQPPTSGVSNSRPTSYRRKSSAGVASLWSSQQDVKDRDKKEMELRAKWGGGGEVRVMGVDCRVESSAAMSAFTRSPCLDVCLRPPLPPVQGGPMGMPTWTYL